MLGQINSRTPLKSFRDEVMRIVYLSNSTVPSRSANSIQVMRMCQAFAANGHEVTLLAVRGEPVNDDYSYYGVDPCFEIVKCPHPRVRWVGSMLHAVCSFGAVMVRFRPDLLYARYAYNLAAVSFLSVPMILEVHDVPSRQQIAATLRHLFRQNHFFRLVAISKALAEEYQRVFPELPSRKVIVAHDGADAPWIIADSVSIERPGRSGCLQVGYTGHLYPGRGIEVILALAAELPDVDFHILGGTDADIAGWQDAYRGPNLLFHGYVPPGEVMHRCAPLDVLLAPYQDRVSTAGGRNTVKWMSPLKLFEYMATGKAIVCSDLPVLREVLTHGMTALLVPPGEHAAWIEAVVQLKKNPVLRAKLGDAAQQEFLAHYTWEKRAKAVVEGLDL